MKRYCVVVRQDGEAIVRTLDDHAFQFKVSNEPSGVTALGKVMRVLDATCHEEVWSVRLSENPHPANPDRVYEIQTVPKIERSAQAAGPA